LTPIRRIANVRVFNSFDEGGKRPVCVAELIALHMR
jgi:hypothetical protein